MRVLVSGGGTGGHIYPAMSIIKHIQENDPSAEFLYVGTAKGLESKIVPEQGIPFKTIEVQGFRRAINLENFKTLYLFMKSLSDSKKLIKEFQPDVVLGTGGYVCGAVVYAAHKLGVPTVIHEQNSVPGITNKFLSKYADKVAICFEEARVYFPDEKVTLTGNPRGQEVAGIEKSDILTDYGLNPEIPTVLIFGGSQGALTLVNAMMEALKEFGEKDYQVLCGTGSRYYERVKEVFEQELEGNKSVVVRPYISDMEKVLRNVDLVVSRAGATSMAEITALGIPAVLVPSPNVTNDHQTKNAMSLVKAKGAELIADSELTGRKLIDTLDRLMANQVELEAMSNASKKLGIPDATERLLQVIEESVLKERNKL